MKAHIDRDGCIGCGLCEEICPEVFHIADDGLAQVILDEVPEDVEDEALEAADSCPTQVIIVE